jgi:integrase/recombinase XerC
VDKLERGFHGARVIGKGDKERQVFFSPECVEALREWLPLREAALRAEALGSAKKSALFINQRGGALTARGMYYIVHEYSRTAGFKKDMHPHALRHSFATHLVNSGCDVRVVQELLGHKSLATTQRYTHVDIEGLKRVYSESHPHGDRTIHNKDRN